MNTNTLLSFLILTTNTSCSILSKTDTIASKADQKHSESKKNFIKPANISKLYYVDSVNGDDHNDGKQLTTAFRTINKVNTLSLSCGDTILFKRGGIFRGHLVPQSGCDDQPIIYADYGEGDKPRIYGSITANSISDWTEHDKNIWENHNPGFAIDVGNIIFNDEQGVGSKKQAKELLLKQGDFWWDNKNHLLLLYSTNNPAKYYNSIECALKITIIDETNKQNISYKNLDLRYGAAHGIGGLNTKGISIDNLNISFIGGGDQYNDYKVRYGNGVEFYGFAESNTVKNTSFDNIYDAAITNQGSRPTDVQSNISYVNNKISRSEYSYEFFNQSPSATVENIIITGNHFEQAGGGWGHNQRWDGANGRHIMIWNSPTSIKNFVIENNVFDQSTESYIRITKHENIDKFTFKNNIYKQGVMGDFLMTDTGKTVFKNDTIDYDDLIKQFGR